MLTGLGIRDLAALAGRAGVVTTIRLRSRLVATPWRHAGTVVELAMPGVEAPLALRAGTSDSLVLGSVFGAREFDFPVKAPSPRFIIDAGANIGLASVYLARRFPEADVIAVEPDAGNFALLQRNARPYRRVTPLHAALWERGGFCHIVNPDAERWAFRVDSTTAEDASAIPAVSVADLLATSGASVIDILKLDVEGAEVEILSNGVEAWLPHVNLLVIELHDRFRPGCSQALERAFRGQPFERSRHGEWELYTRIRES